MSDYTTQDSDSDRAMMQWAVLVIAGAVFLMVAFQTFQLLRAGDNLNRLLAAQEKTVEYGKKLQGRVEQLAGRVAQLAEGGNVRAKQIVDTMARQGVKLSPPDAAAETAPASAPAQN